LAPKLVVYGLIAEHQDRNVRACTGAGYYSFCLDQAHARWKSGAVEIRGPGTNGVRRARTQHSAQTDGLDPVTWLAHGLDVAAGRILLSLSRAAEPDLATRQRILEALIEKMADTASEMHARLLVVFIATQDQKKPPGWLGRSGRYDVIDMTQPFQQNGPDSWIMDDGHISAAAHRMIASAVKQYWAERIAR
jgi:hypothetical protein